MIQLFKFLLSEFNCTRCTYKTNEGHLYLMKKAMIFINKPVIYTRYEDVSKIVIERAQGTANLRTFDITVHCGGDNVIYIKFNENMVKLAPFFDYLLCL